MDFSTWFEHKETGTIHCTFIILLNGTGFACIYRTNKSRAKKCRIKPVCKKINIFIIQIQYSISCLTLNGHVVKEPVTSDRGASTSMIPLIQELRLPQAMGINGNACIEHIHRSICKIRFWIALGGPYGHMYFGGFMNKFQ